MDKIRVGITHGDTNGIGYEVILKVLEDERMADLCTIIVYGSGKAAAFYRKAMELAPVQLNRIDSAADAREGQFNIINVVGEDLKIDPGVAAEAAGQAAFAALEAAVADLVAGDIDVLVTAPINKKTIQNAEFSFPGHTEYLEARLGEEGDQALMIMCNDSMRIALATAHMPLASVPEALTPELIEQKLERFDRSLRRDFGIQSPRIAVLSLNPTPEKTACWARKKKPLSIPPSQPCARRRFLPSALMPPTASSAAVLTVTSTASSPCTTTRVSLLQDPRHG